MTTGHGEKFSRKQKRAIAALLSKPTIVEAAADAGIAEKTLRRWLQNHSFKTAYREACQQCVDAAVKKLQIAMGLAVDELIEILRAKETKFFQKDGIVTDERDVIAWGPRLGAAKTILEIGFRGTELTDLEERLSALEEHLQGRKP